MSTLQPLRPVTTASLSSLETSQERTSESALADPRNAELSGRPDFPLPERSGAIDHRELAQPTLLHPGVSGVAVFVLQERLNHVLLASNFDRIKVNGQFDQATEGAVRIVQSKLNKPISGAWNEESEAALRTWESDRSR